MAAGLLAKKAVERGLQSQPWVKTSLAPGSQVVRDYLEHAGLLQYLEKLRFHVVAYGCTTCIGNSGPIADPIEAAIDANKLVVAAVLSGNRNFEGRIHAKVRGNYLASPPLVVAYALAGSMNVNLESDPLGTDSAGKPVYLREIWPSSEEVQAAVQGSVKPEMFRKRYGSVFEGDTSWQAIEIAKGQRYEWTDSTYVKQPPYFEGLTRDPAPLRDIQGARVLAVLGDSVTTDHISPASPIPAKGPAGEYLQSMGVSPGDLNTFGARRGNHEVMMRGTFANVRLRNKLAPGTEGGFTRLLPEGTQMSIFDASRRYLERGVPLIVIAGQEYGTGSSRDWAAKGPNLLGVRAVIAESFERIHRSNLIGMGILPLVFAQGESAKSLELSGEEVYSIRGIAEGLAPGAYLTVTATPADGRERSFQAKVRIDTPEELEYYRHGGILHYVLRQLASA
jgi:aconitate hydratase